MKHITLLLLCSLLLSSVAKADEMVIQFRVIKSEDVVKQISSGEKIDYSQIPSVAHGYFAEGCSVYLKTKEYQYRIKGTLRDKLILSFSLSMYSQKDGKNVFSSSGEVTLSDKMNTPSLKKGWRDEEYVIIWQRVNLKH